MAETLAPPAFEEISTAFTTERPLGLIIVGQAQVGKTTVRNMVAEAWTAHNPDSIVHEYSASNGFRGLAACALGEARFDLNEPVASQEFEDILDAYVEGFASIRSLGLHIDRLFQEPLPTDILRNPAVNAAAPIVNRSCKLRNEIVNAAGRHLRHLVASPTDKPGLVVVDARSVHEHHPNVIQAGVRFGGTLLITCEEEIAARRLLPKSAGAEEIAAEAARLRARNAEDAKPTGANMTTPDKLRHVHDLHAITQSPHADSIMRTAAAHAIDNPEAGIHIRAERFTIAEEAQAIGLVIRGITHAARTSF